MTSGVSTDWNHCPLEEISPQTSTDSSSPLHPFESDILEDPSTCSIASGRSNTIEIRKGKLGLGLKVVGGSDTILVSVRRSFIVKSFNIYLWIIQSKKQQKLRNDFKIYYIEPLKV